MSFLDITGSKQTVQFKSGHKPPFNQNEKAKCLCFCRVIFKVGYRMVIICSYLLLDKTTAGEAAPSSALQVALKLIQQKGIPAVFQGYTATLIRWELISNTLEPIYFQCYIAIPLKISENNRETRYYSPGFRKVLWYFQGNRNKTLGSHELNNCHLFL